MFVYKSTNGKIISIFYCLIFIWPPMTKTHQSIHVYLLLTQTKTTYISQQRIYNWRGEEGPGPTSCMKFFRKIHASRIHIKNNFWSLFLGTWFQVDPEVFTKWKKKFMVSYVSWGKSRFMLVYKFTNCPHLSIKLTCHILSLALWP